MLNNRLISNYLALKTVLNSINRSKPYFGFILGLVCLFLNQNTQAQRIPFWTYQNLATDVVESGQFPVIHADAAGNLHMSYWNQAADRLVYGFRATGSANWTFERVDDSKSNGYKSAFVIDGSNKIHMAYFENVNGKAQVRYASKLPGGAWQVEVADSNNWGDYGPGSLFGTANIQASIDIHFQQGFLPVIVWFDGTYDAFNLIYGLEMKVAYKNVQGQWATTNNGNMTIANSCPLFGETFAGARYGEHCKLAKLPNGNFFIITFAKNNGHMMRFKQLNPSFALQRDIIDSTRRITNIGPSNSLFCLATNSLTFNGISTTTDPSGRVHIFYGLDQDYGRAVVFRNYHSLHYMRIETDGSTFFRRMLLPATIPPGDGINRGYTSCVNIGNDTVIVSFAEPESDRYRMLVSTDGGTNFGSPILIANTQVPRTPANLTVVGDTLYCAYYDNASQTLRVGAFNHRVPGSSWVFRSVTRSEQRGLAFDAIVQEAGQNDIFHMVYSDALRGELYYGSYTNGGSLSETTISSGDSFDYLDVEQGPANELYVTFSNRTQSRLSLATNATGTWVSQTITSTAAGDHVDLEVNGTTLHAIFYDETSRQLRYATKQLTGSSWAFSVVDDGQTEIRGENCRMSIDGNNNPHVVYFDRAKGGIRYATFGGSTWTIDTLPLNPNKVYGTGLGLVLDPNNQAHIFFRAEADNSIGYAKGTIGNWTIDTSIVLPTTFGVRGKPIQVKLDQDGILWAAYNISASAPDVQLLTQHPVTKAWTPIDVTANRDAIGESFSFMISDDALYIAGRTNITNRKGLGLLLADDGRVVLGLEDEDANTPTLTLFPNPTNGPISLKFNNIRPDLLSGSTCTIEVHDVQGQVVLKSNIIPESEGIISLDMNQLATGVYICRTTIGQHSLTQKFVVVR